MLVNSGRRWLFGYICHFVISFLIHKFHFSKKKKKIFLQRSLFARSAPTRCSFSMKKKNKTKTERESRGKQNVIVSQCEPYCCTPYCWLGVGKWNWICRILSVWLHEMFPNSFYRQFPCGHACLRKKCKHLLLGVQWSLKKWVSLLPPILKNIHTQIRLVCSCVVVGEENRMTLSTDGIKTKVKGPLSVSWDNKQQWIKKEHQRKIRTG